MNYIKGYRYELYCLARNSMSTLCLVFCDTDKETAREWCESQEETKESNHFPPDMFEDYASRMEYPNQAKRWDQPLFHLRKDEELPLDKIHEALCDAKYKPKDPVSTKQE